MATNIIADGDAQAACLYDDRTNRAFGPVTHGAYCVDLLAGFAIALEDDPRSFTEWELAFRYAAYIESEEGQRLAREGGGASGVEAGPETPTFANTPTGEHPTVTPPAPSDALPNERGAAPDIVSDNAGPTLPRDGLVDDPDTVSGGTPTPVTPPDMPVGARICWNCQGHRVEPNGSREPCGICVGKGWLAP